MLVAVASVKGAPGVTRLAMTMAALWPGGSEPMLIEADAAGGTIAGRYRLNASPSLTTLAAAVYPSAQDVRIHEHAQGLPGGLPVVVAPTDPAGVRAAVADLAASGGLLEQAAEDADTVVVVDCGRLDTDRLSPLFALADEVLLVVCPLPEMIGPLHASIRALRPTEAKVGLVLRGAGYDAGEMNRVLGVEVAGRLPEAPEAGVFAKSRRANYARAVQKIVLSVAARMDRRATAEPVS